jgi:hypothetical protein
MKHGFSEKLINDEWYTLDIVRKNRTPNIKDFSAFFKLDIIKEIWKNPFTGFIHSDEMIRFEGYDLGD